MGVGINVNQTEFDASLPNPVSMAQLLDGELNVEDVLQRFLVHLQRNYNALREIKNEELKIKNSDNCQLSIVNCQLNTACASHKRYNELLYRLNEYHTYALPSGERFEAKILGTASSGALRLENEAGEIKDYLFKEVEFIII